MPKSLADRIFGLFGAAECLHIRSAWVVSSSS